ncbi:AraC family transcriptional regulator [Pedobacter metabolipauper]|uniref:AraC-like DNA-binding protein n=1 Tax=Pedobacter metabolipauper TaxID=425513 RepID=A0A4R6SY79_9SPHI|nr:helix-turn-helix domain-containing protein [Pedobacter metabolipauper]TDQ09445.1 AraC-like DNA-binding protein [Pedobacter metabolipauper]
MKISREIPLHRLDHKDVYASYAEEIDLGDFSTSHRIDFFAVIWYCSDRDTQYIDFEPYPVKTNLVYLLARNQVHALPGVPPKAKVLLLSKEFFDRIEEEDLRFLFFPFNNEAIVIPDEQTETLSRLFDLILHENKNDNESRLLHFYTNAYLLQLQRLSQNSTTRSALIDPRMRKLFQLISIHYKSQKLVGFYADKIGLSAKRVNQIVTEKTGITVSQLIYNYILIEAKREISHHDKSFKEIAIDLGFKGQSYFSRFFKRHTGTTPESFRQRHL